MKKRVMFIAILLIIGFYSGTVSAQQPLDPLDDPDFNMVCADCDQDTTPQEWDNLLRFFFIGHVSEDDFDPYTVQGRNPTGQAVAERQYYRDPENPNNVIGNYAIWVWSYYAEDPNAPPTVGDDLGGN